MSTQSSALPSTPAGSLTVVCRDSPRIYSTYPALLPLKSVIFDHAVFLLSIADPVGIPYFGCEARIGSLVGIQEWGNCGLHQPVGRTRLTHRPSHDKQEPNRARCHHPPY